MFEIDFSQNLGLNHPVIRPKIPKLFSAIQDEISSTIEATGGRIPGSSDQLAAALFILASKENGNKTTNLDRASVRMWRYLGKIIKLGVKLDHTKYQAVFFNLSVTLGTFRETNIILETQIVPVSLCFDSKWMFINDSGRMLCQTLGIRLSGIKGELAAPGEVSGQAFHDIKIGENLEDSAVIRSKAVKPNNSPSCIFIDDSEELSLYNTKDLTPMVVSVTITDLIPIA